MSCLDKGEVDGRTWQTTRLPDPVLAPDNGLATLCGNLFSANSSLARGFEEQRRTVAFLDQVAHVTPVGRVTVVLNVLSAGRIGKSVFVAGCGRGGFGMLFHALGLLALHTVDGVCLALEDTRDGRAGVVAGCDGATSFLDCGNGGGAGAAYDNVDGVGKSGFGVCSAAGEQLDTVLDAVEAA